MRTTSCQTTIRAFPRQHGGALKALLLSATAYAVLTAVWVVVFESIIRPEYLVTSDIPFHLRMMAWFLTPLALLMFILSGCNYHAQAQEQKAQACKKAQEEADAQRQKLMQQEAEQAQKQREFALEVRGLGIALDRFRQTRIWEALDKAQSPFHSIMPQDPKAYPWSWSERWDNADKRRGDAWEYALRGFVERWPIPVILIAPPRHPSSEAKPLAEKLSRIDQMAGLGITLYTLLEAEHTDHADRMIAKLFEWFEKHPEMPAAVVLSADGMMMRDVYRAKGSPAMLKDGYEVPKLFDAMTAILVTRSDRVDAQIRPYAYDAPYQMHKEDGTGYDNVPFTTIKLWKYYFASEKEYAKQHNGSIAMTADFWHKRVKDFIAKQNPDADDSCSMTPFWDKTKGFKPNPWIPVRWVNWQLEEYDDAPVLGYLHRPVFVSFKDAHGKPLNERGRAQALAEGWKKALTTLPAGGQDAAPQRVFYDTGADSKRVIPLSRALAEIMPDLDPMDAQAGFNVSQRIGDIGITSPLAQIGLGLMRGYFKGGASATVDLRHDDGAYLTMVRPPSEQQKKANKRQPDPFMVKLLPQLAE